MSRVTSDGAVNCGNFRRLEEPGASHELHVERRVLPHQHRIEVGERRLVRRKLQAVPVRVVERRVAEALLAIEEMQAHVLGDDAAALPH
jgi:hypothetical protein